MDEIRKTNIFVDHYDKEVFDFFSEHFKEGNRKCLFIGGAGFDPRSTTIVRSLAAVLNSRLHVLALREDRPDPKKELIIRAEKNVSIIESLECSNEIKSIDIFASDGAVVGGINACNSLKEQKFENYTDIVLDLSALSIGVSFPIVKYIYDLVRLQNKEINVHLTVASNAKLESCVTSYSIDRVSYVRGFPGMDLLGEEKTKAKLWLPIISSGKKDILRRIYSEIGPHDTCPIFPFPSEIPQKGDMLVTEYIRELEVEWEVDPRNFVYADEMRPLDIFRTILRIDEERKSVFETFGGSVLVLSPLGRRMLTLGLLMAALKRPFPVAYIENLEYDVDWGKVDSISDETSKIAHVWLHGEAYHFN